MTGQTNMDHESPAVQKHLEIMQGVITRMAENSRFCKMWSVSLVAATLVLVARTEKPEYAFIALVPAVLLLILDTYYLALERTFRKSYSMFVDKLHGGNLIPSDLYEVAPSGSVARHFMASLKSFSIWPFYLTLLGMTLFLWLIVKP